MKLMSHTYCGGIANDIEKYSLCIVKGKEVVYQGEYTDDYIFFEEYPYWYIYIYIHADIYMLIYIYIYIHVNMLNVKRIIFRWCDCVWFLSSFIFHSEVRKVKGFCSFFKPQPLRILLHIEAISPLTLLGFWASLIALIRVWPLLE